MSWHFSPALADFTLQNAFPNSPSRIWNFAAFTATLINILIRYNSNII